jgi:hypothetical protein
MTFDERLAAIRAAMIEHKLDAIVAIHDGAHFIETPNPVLVLSGFKSLGPAAVVLPRDGEATLIVTPAWDADRAAECCPTLRVIAADDVADALTSARDHGSLRGARIGMAGLAFTRWDIAGRLAQMLPQASAADDIVFDAAAAKTWRRSRMRARPRASPSWLCAPHRDRASRHERGRACARAQVVHQDPRRRGQFPAALRRAAQCGGGAVERARDAARRRPGGRDHAELPRTARADLPHRHARPASAELKHKYGLLVRAMMRHSAAHPGAPMASVCRAINTVLEAEGYGEYCHPPHIRRRGTGWASARSGRATSASTTRPCSRRAWCS